MDEPWNPIDEEAPVRGDEVLEYAETSDEAPPHRQIADPRWAILLLSAGSVVVAGVAVHMYTASLEAALMSVALGLGLLAAILGLSAAAYVLRTRSRLAAGFARLLGWPV